MEILVIDGQGGGMGSAITRAIKLGIPDACVTAVGTNSIAAMNMLKAGADNVATGENSVVVCARKAKVIIGPVGIVIADSLLGEITEKMAYAVGSSDAKKILLPVNLCGNIIVGVPDLTVGKLIAEAIEELKKGID